LEWIDGLSSPCSLITDGERIHSIFAIANPDKLAPIASPA
jgi:hypothetical protein